MNHYCQALFELSSNYFVNTRVALDVGSKFGHYAYFLKDRFDRVICFDMRDKIQWKEQKLGDNVEFVMTALGDRDGFTFYDGAHTTQNSGKKCPVARLDTLDYRVVDHIKLDVEGDELSVLKGAEQTILRCRPVISLEQNDTVEQYQKGVKFDAMEWLQDRGYLLRGRSNNDYVLTAS